MNIPARLQKFALLIHITVSVGWFGAVVPYLALAIAGLSSRDVAVSRAAWLAMELVGWYVIVPLSLAALLSGLVQSLGTQWGLFRHWWVVGKLLLTLFAVAVLLRHMQDVSRVARLAKETTLSKAAFHPELIHAAGGLLVLFAAMILSVFKPWGMTASGRRGASQSRLSARPAGETTPGREPVLVTRRVRWGRVVGIHAILLALLLAILHTTGFLHH